MTIPSWLSEQWLHHTSGQPGPTASLPPPAQRYPQLTWPLPTTSPGAEKLSIFHLYRVIPSNLPGSEMRLSTEEVPNSET